MDERRNEPSERRCRRQNVGGRENTWQAASVGFTPPGNESSVPRRHRRDDAYEGVQSHDYSFSARPFPDFPNSPFVTDTAFRVACFEGEWVAVMCDLVFPVLGAPFIVSRRLVKSLVCRRLARSVSRWQGHDRPSLAGHATWLCGQTLFEKLFHTVRKKEERIDAA